MELTTRNVSSLTLSGIDKDIRSMAKHYTAYKIGKSCKQGDTDKLSEKCRTMDFISSYCLVGDGINKVYFPVFIPIGILGNILSFVVRLLKTYSQHIYKIK